LQPQLPQAVHVLDDSSATGLLLLQRLRDFRFASPIAVEYGLGDCTLIALRHEDPFSSVPSCGARMTICEEIQINAAKS
jgi:hypothetical protein